MNINQSKFRSKTENLTEDPTNKSYSCTLKLDSYNKETEGSPCLDRNSYQCLIISHLSASAADSDINTDRT